MPPRSRRVRPSAPLLLGLYAGSVAGLAVLPIALVALVVNWSTSTSLALEAAVVVADARAALHDVDVDVDTRPIRWARDLAVLIRVDGPTLTVERGPPELSTQLAESPQIAALCAPGAGPSPLNLDGRHRWAWACATRDDVAYVAAVEPPLVQTPVVLTLIFALATAVGLIAAFIIRRVLSPLTAISRGLARVSAGERDVRLSPTGLAELDDLIARVNATAEAAEQREDEITVRIKTVQRRARVVAHEVRNPLQSVELLTSVLVDEPDPAERARHGEAIRHEIQLLDQVVSRMLKRSVGDDLELRPQPFDLGVLLDHVYRLHAPRARASGLTLSMHAPSTLEIIGDQALLGRCVENLTLNALQHARSAITVSAEARLGRVLLEIEDDGPGVDPLVAERMFEANISQRAGGSGLGLALVHAVVHAHHGTITVDRSRQGGARFVVDLPVHQPTPTPAAPRRGLT